MGSREEAIDRAVLEDLSERLVVVDRVGPGDWAAVDDPKKLPARADSVSWCARLLHPKADPHREDLPVRRAYHAATDRTFDLLRYQYVLDGIDVELIESRNFLLARFPKARVLLSPEVRRAADVERLISRVLNASGETHPVTLRLPPKIEEGGMFTSGPGVDVITMTSWDQRVEGGIRGGVVWLLCYKKRPQQEPGFPDASEWFHPSYRRK